MKRRHRQTQVLFMASALLAGAATGLWLNEKDGAHASPTAAAKTDKPARTDKPAKTDKPQDSVQVPQDSVQVPQDSVQVPQDSVQVPQDIVKVPQDSVQVPQESVQAPQDSVQVPQESVQVLQDIVQAPQESGQVHGNAMKMDTAHQREQEHEHEHEQVQEQVQVQEQEQEQEHEHEHERGQDGDVGGLGASPGHADHVNPGAPDMQGNGVVSGAADEVEWKWLTGVPKARETGRLRITVKDAGGKPDGRLQISHERKLHLIIVSQGLATFMHLHPTATAEPGVFEVPVAFPAEGRYRLVADFKPQDGAAQWRSTWVQTDGAVPQQGEPALRSDKQLEREVNGMTVSLTFDRAPMAGEPLALSFSFRDGGSGKLVRNLQPYLGAAGHVVIMDAEARDYLHVHAMDGPGGEEAKFHTTFPVKGLYKIWGQFQRNNRVFTVPFVVEVY